MERTETLTDRLRRQAEAGQPISREDALRWAHQFSREQLSNLIALMETMIATRKEEQPV